MHTLDAARADRPEKIVTLCNRAAIGYFALPRLVRRKRARLLASEASVAGGDAGSLRRQENGGPHL